MRVAVEEDKFKELVLYISQKCALNPKFGVTKLNKILFYADFISYRVTGAAITGATYRKMQYGPVPDKMERKLRTYAANRELDKQTILFGGKKLIRPVNLRAPDLSVFTAAEIALVDNIIDALGPLHTETVSDLSHKEIGWLAANIGERIPYSTALLTRDEPNQYDYERALARA